MAQVLNVLIVDDNRSAADALARVLRRDGDNVEATYDGATAIERIKAAPPDLVLTDLKMEPVDGLAVLRAAREMRPPVEVIVFTAFGGVDVAVKAMRLGARDFLTKPVTVEQVAQRLDALRDRASSPPLPTDTFVAESSRAKELHAQLVRAATVPSPVWIQGELGSGRGFCAHTLHRLGRPEEPFTIRDLGRDAPWPQRGTVLLPNLDDLPDDLQRGLHRALGSLPPGVRLVSTAALDGQRLITEGRLRPELYYALSVIVVNVPSLRNRPEDVMPLLRQAIDTRCARYGRTRPEIPPEVGERLVGHSWPGNVRELLNLAERVVVMGPDAWAFEVVESPTEGMPRLEPGFDLAQYLEGIERRILVAALQLVGGDRNRAGRLLGVERNTLRYKLNKYGLLDK